MQLTGKIISTGNGKIEAVDGYGRIHIDNQTTKALLLRGVSVGEDIEAKIIITDTGRTGANNLPHQTIYTRTGNSIRVVDNTTVDSRGHGIECSAPTVVVLPVINPKLISAFIG